MDDPTPDDAEASSTPPGVMPLSMPPSGDVREPALGADPDRSSAPLGAWFATPAPSLLQAGSRRRRSTAAVLLAVLLAGVVGAAIGLAVGSREPIVTGPGAFILPPSGSGQVAGGSGSLPGDSGSLSAISKTLTPAVVDIDTAVDEGDGVGEAAGSGMILTSGGEVLTNNHVIEDAARISVLIYGRSRPVAARVVGVDTVHDVALLQLTGVGALPHVELGNSADLKVGDGVVAIGNALGLGGPPAVTGGAVSALDQSITATSEVTPSSESLHGLIETDAQIQPGDSGGPLVDTAGRVVGMDTAAASNDGGAAIGFAIPINQAIAIANNIEKGIAKNGIIVGLSAFLGVEVKSVTNGRGAPVTGAFVEAVIPDGPAAMAGVVAGDTITAMDGKALTADASSLTAILLTLKPGARARLRVVGPKGTASTVPVVLGSIPL
jgi:S1-C subfamily serine protease